ncbi:carbohydrate ABC transporter permease [Paenibacillus sp. WQ 127069]|uniref:Carbohydrate ABC transporter permease n=1 Tax=Paenibacillus baimaensis TaxID=2982185 RepID=A0ABT2UIH2_9BACL|nr:carbohydrate ABC transporter permease [Paenibacillus sp. WQ 127069]MCU6794449.1 carbohydrate ABC transporter permease [Paenibacillus sp. WQ 127069]
MKRKSFGFKLFDIVNTLIMVVVIMIMLYPMVFVFAASISDNAMVASGQVLLWPKGINFGAYEKIIVDENLWISYWNTIRYTVVQTVLTLIATSAMAYPLAKRWLIGRKWILILAAFTLVFNGGLIPTFLLVKQLNMLDTIWAIVLPSLISTWHLFIMRTFFEGLPEEIEDAAIMDGCGSMQVLLRVVVPLSLPVMMTIGLFTAVNQWNAFFDALLYLNSGKMHPLQIMLRSVLIAGNNPQGEGDQSYIESLKYALIVIATLPILCVYPFIQKYFVQGSMIGGVKG